jgi:hypothetical protein
MRSGFSRLSQFANERASFFHDLVRGEFCSLAASERRLRSQFRAEDLQFVSSLGVERNPLWPSPLFRFVFDLAGNKNVFYTRRGWAGMHQLNDPIRALTKSGQRHERVDAWRGTSRVARWHEMATLPSCEEPRRPRLGGGLPQCK